MTPPLKAALWMIGAIFSFTAMAVAAREISQTHDSFEIMAARSIIGLALVLIIGKAVGQLGHISGHRLSGHFWRGGDRNGAITVRALAIPITRFGFSHSVCTGFERIGRNDDLGKLVIGSVSQKLQTFLCK